MGFSKKALASLREIEFPHWLNSLPKNSKEQILRRTEAGS
jgi:hypothetical protein